MVEILLQAGADISARSHWWAGSFGVLDHDGPLVDVLISRGATIDVHAAPRLGVIDRLEALVSADRGLVSARSPALTDGLEASDAVREVLQRRR